MQIKCNKVCLVSFQLSTVSYLLGQWPTKPNKDVKQKKLGFMTKLIQPFKLLNKCTIASIKLVQWFIFFFQVEIVTN